SSVPSSPSSTTTATTTPSGSPTTPSTDSTAASSGLMPTGLMPSPAASGPAPSGSTASAGTSPVPSAGSSSRASGGSSARRGSTSTPRSRPMPSPTPGRTPGRAVTSGGGASGGDASEGGGHHGPGGQPAVPQAVMGVGHPVEREHLHGGGDGARLGQGDHVVEVGQGTAAGHEDLALSGNRSPTDVQGTAAGSHDGQGAEGLGRPGRRPEGVVGADEVQHRFGSAAPGGLLESGDQPFGRGPRRRHQFDAGAGDLSEPFGGGVDGDDPGGRRGPQDLHPVAAEAAAGPDDHGGRTGGEHPGHPVHGVVGGPPGAGQRRRLRRVQPAQGHHLGGGHHHVRGHAAVDAEAAGEAPALAQLVLSVAAPGAHPAAHVVVAHHR